MRGVPHHSASWCGPDREFTPGLGQACRELKAKPPGFEVVFVSADHSAGDMRDYMKEDRMPWPTVKYEARSEKITSCSGPGIPGLVLVDAKGQVLADSFQGDNCVGPRQALAETRRILQRGR